MWTIQMLTLKRPDEIKLKMEMDSFIINCDFVDAIDNPVEQPPEQTQQAPPPIVNEVPSPQASLSDDDTDTPDLLPSNDADDVRRKLKDAWEQTCFTETFPDKHVTESTDDA
jgi:hypothetical protein